MKIDLQNKKALVGGSTQGLGKAIAMQLAACGASVTLMSRNEQKLQTVLSELDASAGQQHSILEVDFSDITSFRKKVDHFFAGQKIDVLVNNTNGPAAGTITQKKDTDYQSAFDLLFQTVSYTTMAALPQMQAQQWGRIINVSSLTVKEPVATLVLSNTMRSAIASWMKSLSAAVGKDGITVNNILTGYFDTERLQSLTELQAAQLGKTKEAVMQERIAQVPAQRLGKPDEYGYLAAFLASEFAGYINGANIPLDGGLLRSI